MVRLSTIFQSEGFQKGFDESQKKRKPKKEVSFKEQPKKKRKIGPYDPQVVHAVEAIRQSVEETEPELKAKIEKDLKAETSSKATAEVEEGEINQDSQENPLVCPFHIELLANVPNAKGYNLLKCPSQPCLISLVGKDEAKSYMKGAYKDVHQDILNRWGELLCFCGFLPRLRQSHSYKNPGRMYLTCRNKPFTQCQFLRWADQAIEFNNWKDPFSIQKWLMEAADAAAPPPLYSESMKDFQKRGEMVEIDPPYVPLHKDVIERAKIGLF